MAASFHQRWGLRTAGNSEVEFDHYSGLRRCLIVSGRRRAENLAKANALMAEGKHNQARDFYAKAVDITPQMAYQLIKVRLSVLLHDIYGGNSRLRLDTRWLGAEA